MDKSLGTLLLFGGLFPIYKGPTPPLTPQTKLVACVGWGEGELQENFKKDVLFMREPTY